MSATADDRRLDRLLRFLPAFESGGSHGRWRGGEQLPDGASTFPYFEYSGMLQRFVDACYEGGWVRYGFNWREWTDEALAYVENPRLLDDADVPTIEQLLTAHIRNDRFTEGHLAAMVEAGHVTAILRRLQALRGDALPTHEPNIFEVLQTVSSRIEPYHSAFLAAMLRWSISGNRDLFDAFWTRAAPASWPTPGDDVTIVAEDVIGLGRVDIVILVGSTRVLGIEVKTREASTTAGQLSKYLEGLTAKYAGRDIAIAFLTPFDRSRAGNSAATLRSVAEFEEFAATFPDCRHLSWLDVAEVEWDGGELWEQHRQFLRTVVSSDARLRTWGPDGRSREFADFFGVDAAELFDQRLAAVVGEHEGHTLPLERVGDAAAFADAFRTLIESNDLKGAQGRPNSFKPSLQGLFLEGPFAEVHRALFRLADEYPNVWLQGRGNYGLRVAHPAHRSGVSLLTSRGVDRVEIGKPR